MESRCQVDQVRQTDCAGERVYPMGHRLTALKYSAAVVVLVISVVFYFIYDFIFTPIFPDFMGLPLILFILFIDVLLISLVLFVCDKVQKGIYYRVGSEFLEYTTFGKSTKYYWEDFTNARYGRISMGVLCPVEFTVKGRSFYLNQYVRGVWNLAEDILYAITPYVKIELGLIDRVKVMTDLI